MPKLTLAGVTTACVFAFSPIVFAGETQATEATGDTQQTVEAQPATADGQTTATSQDSAVKAEPHATTMESTAGAQTVTEEKKEEKKE